VKVTGHSLGGALAELTGLRLSLAGTHVYMISFGQPKIGDEAFANFSNSHFAEQWRVVNKKDPVAHLPLASLWTYKHAGVEIYEDKDGSLK
jgi:predicted lipase